MPKSKKPRKAYKPKYVEGQLPITIRHTNASDTMLQMIPHSDLERLRDGTADDYVANTLAFRLNWGYVMAGEYFDTPEARACTEAGLAAIRSVKERHERLGKWGCTGPEFAAMGQALNLTDEMQAQTTRRQQRDAAYITLAVSEFKKGGINVEALPH